MNLNWSDAEWNTAYSNRVARLKRLIELNAPKMIIASECELVILSYMRLHTKRAMVWNMFKREIRHAFHLIRLEIKIWWLQKYHGYTEDEAIDEACQVKKKVIQ